MSALLTAWSWRNPAYIGKYDMVRDVKPGGIFMINCDWEGEELEARLPADIKRAIAKKKIKLYTVDAVNIARSIGLKRPDQHHHPVRLLQAG